MNRSRRAGAVAAVVLALLLLGACAGGTTRSAVDVTATGATLRGTVSSNQDETAAYWFRYGRTSSYGSETPRRSIVIADRSERPVEEAVSGLEPQTTYHFSLCAKSPDESAVCGANVRFTTARADEPTPTRLSVTTEPRLYSAFDPQRTDYVTRCGGDPVTVEVAAPSDTQVAIDGDEARSGRFSQAVRLKEGQRFSFSTTAGGRSSTYHVRCLPGNFPDWTFTSGSGQSAIDYALLTPLKGDARYVTMFNAHGVPVWWYRAASGPLDASLLSDNSVAYEVGSSGPFGDDPAAYEVRRLDGSFVRWLTASGSPTDFHDLEELPGGNYLLLSYRPRDHVDLSAYGGPSDATVLDAVIQELRPDSSVSWEWNSKDHIALSETGRWWPSVTANPPKLPDGRTVYDIVHINSVEFDGYSLIISLRHTDAVYRIFRGDGHVEWKLGGTTTSTSLTVNGDSRNPSLGAQHDARRLADGTVSVHDNGTQLGRPPRSVRFRIDPTARTATLVESVSDPEVPSSPCCGSSRKLGSGGWLVDWGHFNGATIGEYAADGSRIFKLEFPGTLSYRAFPVERGRIQIERLRQAMDTMYPR